MIEIETDLAREKRAREMYENATNRSLWLVPLLLVASFAGGASARWLGLPDLGGRLLACALIAIVYFSWNTRVKGSIRRAGLPTRSRSEVEIAQRAPGPPPGKWVEVSQLLDFGVHVVVTLFILITAVSLFNQLFPIEKQTFNSTSFWNAAGIFCIAFVPWYFLKYKSSTVRVDERGVFGYAFYFSPRLVLWENIDQVYVRRVYHPLTGKHDLNLLLKNAQGKTVLALGGIAFKAIPRKKSNHIVGEIRRHFYGDTPI